MSYDRVSAVLHGDPKLYHRSHAVPCSATKPQREVSDAGQDERAPHWRDVVDLPPQTHTPSERPAAVRVL